MSISCIICLRNGPGSQHYEHQLQRLFLARGRGASIMSISYLVCLCNGPGGQHHEHQLHCLFVEWAGGPAS